MCHLEELAFADDICFLSINISHLPRKTDKMIEVGAKFGLKINSAKTKIMKVNCAESVTTGNYLVIWGAPYL